MDRKSAFGCFTVGITLWLLIFAGWFGKQWVADNPIPLLIPLLLALLAITVGVGYMKLPTATLVKLLMPVVAIIAGLYFFEIFLTWYGNPKDFENERASAALTEGIKMDKRDRFEVYLDELKNGTKNIRPYIPASNFVEKSPMVEGNDERIIFPLGGYSNVTTIYCNELGEFSLFESDRYGFNNPDEIWDEQIDVAIVGDSFGHGACVPPEDNAAAVIRETYPNTISLGGSGNGPLLELASIREYLPSVKPKHVVWFYYEGNDLLDLQTEKNNSFVRQYFDDPTFNQNLIERQHEVNKIREHFIDNVAILRQIDLDEENRLTKRVPQFMGLYQIRRMLSWDYENMPDEAQASIKPTRKITAKDDKEQTLNNEPSAEEQLDHYNQMIADLPENLPMLLDIYEDGQKLIESWGGQLTFVYIPQWERYGLEDEDVPDETFQRLETVPIFTKNLIVNYVDMKLIMDEQEDPLANYPFRINGHFNETGYRLLGESITESLTQLDE